MPITIQDRTISRVLVVDDNPAAREGFGYPIEELALVPVSEDGPLTDIGTFIAQLPGKADAILCDYHLMKHDYASFNGDELTAACYKEGIPALLCTQFTDVDVTLNRNCLRYIPSLLRTSSPDPATIASSLDRCLQEIKGSFHPARKPWRTLVRVGDVGGDDRYCYVVVPAWNPRKQVRLYLDNLPADIRPLLCPGKRLHAQVNIGAPAYEELYFVEWERD